MYIAKLYQLNRRPVFQTIQESEGKASSIKTYQDKVSILLPRTSTHLLYLEPGDNIKLDTTTDFISSRQK